MKTKIAIYGGTNLSGDLITFVSSLVKNLLQFPEVVLMSGGFDHYIKHPERKSVDKAVCEAAKQFVDPESFDKRFETWLPAENDRNKVIRFEEGKVIKVSGSTQARRFNIVQHSDAVITIKGEGHTRSVIELALAINKPVLPIPFTGGDSKEMWTMYKEDITRMLRLSPELNAEIQTPLNDLDTGLMAKKLAGFIKDIGEKKCLVLMPFGKEHDNFYDNFLQDAIDDAGYSCHRIDRSDPAGNIPSLFKNNIERARAIIVDITNLNSNVLYELGYVHAFDIVPLIILRKKREPNLEEFTVPFYLKQEMIITVTDDEDGYKHLQESVTKFLAAKSKS